MPIGNTPRFGCIADFLETTPASATSAAAIQRAVTIGSGQASPSSPLAATLVPGTGVPSGVNVVLDGVIPLAASGTTTIDLTAFNSKALAKCRGYMILNANAPDAGAASNITVAAGATNGFTAGGKFTTTAQTVEPGSFIAASNLNTAGWTVSSTLKNVVITAGTAGATVWIVFFGE